MFKVVYEMLVIACPRAITIIANYNVVDNKTFFCRQYDFPRHLSDPLHHVIGTQSERANAVRPNVNKLVIGPVAGTVDI